MIERYLKPAIKNYIAYEEKRMMEEFLDMEREGNSFAPKQIG
jgi:hypothetical protein